MKQDITRQVCHVCHKPFYECECDDESIKSIKEDKKEDDWKPEDYFKVE